MSPHSDGFQISKKEGKIILRFHYYFKEGLKISLLVKVCISLMDIPTNAIALVLQITHKTLAQFYEYRL